MYRNRWTYAFCNALFTLALNLATRAIWWPEKELLSWNVPLSLLLGYLVGHAVWPLYAWMQRKHTERMAALEARHAEIMSLVDEFLANPESGVRRERPARKSNDHNPEVN